MGDPEQGVRALELGCAHGLRHEARRRRIEERRTDPVDGHHRDVEAERRIARHHREGEHARADRPQGVGRQHDPVARQPVGHDAADEDEREPGDDVGRVDDADVRGRAVLLEDRERQRDRSEVVADQRDGLAGEEQAKLALPERCDGVGRAHAARC